MDEQIRILKLAEKNQLPDRIDENSPISVTAFRELYEANLVEGIDVSHSTGIAYLNPRITLAGREYLKDQQVSWLLRLKSKPWEWIFSGIGVFAIGWLVTWLWDKEPPKPLLPNIIASDESIVFGGDITVTASEEGSTAIAATGPVTVNQRDPLVSKAIRGLTQQLEAMKKELTAYLKKDQAREVLFQKLYQDLEEAIKIIPKLTNLPNVQARIDEALSEAAHGNSEPAEMIFLEIERKRVKEGQEHMLNKPAAEAARYRGALALLHDPNRALEAYHRSNELNPDVETERLIEFSKVIFSSSKSEESLEKLEHKTASIVLQPILTKPAGRNLREADLREEDINIYARACSIGAANTYSDETEFRVALGILERKALGEGEFLSKSSIEDLKQEFPGLKGEKSRLQALTLYQDCLFRHIEKFHSRADTEPTATFSPEIPDERRRELLFLVDRLDNWKQTMELAVSILPTKYYDRKSGTNINLRADRRIAEIDTYQPYEMFREVSGEFDFSNLTNNDLAILCQIWQREITNYYNFHQQYQAKFPTLPNYWRWPYMTEEKRICDSATAAR